ncbi:MAG: GAF domain-containing protein [Anaerolineales bacterium]|nr:MAG: GAF domain-containing protein [Anaerolineales bacterium]
MVDHIDTSEEEMSSPTLLAGLEEKQPQRELSILHQATMAIGSARSEQELYDIFTHTLSGLGFSVVLLAFDPIAQELTLLSAATPQPRLLRALERLAGLTLTGYQIPLDQLDFCRRVIQGDQAKHFKLGTEYFVQLLPESCAHLVPAVVRRAGLDYVIATCLKADEKTVGVLVAAREDLAPEDIPTIRALSDQVSVAIANARLMQAERRQRQAAEMLGHLVVTLKSMLNVDQVLSTVVHHLQALYPTAACSVSFLEDGEDFVFRATTDASIEVSQHISCPVGESIARQAICERKVQLINDVNLSPDHRAETARLPGVAARSLLTAPLSTGGQPLGVIQILNAAPNVFTKADAELLASIAALVETTLDRARVDAQRAQLAEAEHRQHEVAETLRRVAVLVSASLDLDTVLDRILEQLAQVVDYDSTSLMIVEDNKLSMRATRGFDESDQVLQIVSNIADNPLFQEMAASRRPIRIPDVKTDHRYRHWAGAYRIRSWIGVPLVVRDRVIGQLAVDKHQPNYYRDDDAELVLAFAQQAAAAIENAQLFDSERRQREIAESLQEVAAILNASLDLDTVLTRIMEQLRRVVEYDSASVLLQDDGDLIVSGGLGFAAPHQIIGQRISLSRDVPSVYVFKHQRPLVIADIRADSTWVDVPAPEHIRGWMGVPLLAGEKPIGVLAVDSAKVGAYHQADAQVVQSFANQATIAIENARLYQAERDRRQEIEAVQRASLSLTASLGLRQVLDSILEAALDLVSARNAHIFLYSAGHLSFGAALWADGSQMGPVAEPRPDGLTYHVAQQGEAVAVPDMRSHSLYADVPSDWNWMGSIVGLPLKIGQRVVGVMNISWSEPGPFSKAELRVLRLLADHAAIAIENARLFEAEQRQRQMAEAQHRSALALISTMALDQVFERILSELQNVVPYDSASVQLLKEDQLEIIGGRGFPNLPELLGVSFPVRGENPNALVLESREPVIIDDVRPHYAAFSQEPHAAADIHGWLGVPLLIGDQVIGMLALDKQQPGFYTESHARTAMAYAAQAAIAIENARLHQALRDYAAELETRVETRTAEVSRERERLLAVLESAGEAIAIADAEGAIEYANPAWEKLTGHDAAQTIQQKTRVLDKETFPDLLVAVRNVAQHQRIWRREMVGQRPDGATYVVDLTVTPVFDDAKQLVNLVATYRDVTQYKELDRIKSEFLSTAAHELRSPLTSILGFSELLLIREDLSGEEQTRFLKHIYDHAIHLKQLVGDLLDISRMESGIGPDVEFEPVDLYPLLEEEIQSWQEAHPGHTYRLDINHERPQVQADRDRICQVLRNLLSNATKYSPNGTTVTLKATPAGGLIELTVADEGIGMTSDELTHIFEKFWRADASSTAVEGTGLGLIIVKHIVEQHGGHIWVDSTKGKGTMVHFTLPVIERQTTVLIAEDEDSVREIEHRILASNGIATLLARNGKQAVEMANAHRPDLVLLDLMMPGMTGQQVLHALKSNPATQHIPVLVVSARSSWQTIEESYALGAVDFLTKPFEYQELLSRVRRALKTATSSRQATAGKQ